MADIFVNSGGGAPVSPFVNWTDAAATLADALAVATNADTIYVSNAHSATTASNVAKTLTCPATPGLKILCVVPSGSTGNSGLSTGAIEAIGAYAQPISVVGCAYIYGMSILGGTLSSSAGTLNLGHSSSPSNIVMESCAFEIRNANASASFFVGQPPASANDENSIHLIDCTFKFGATTQGIFPRGGRLRFVNTGFDSAGSTPTTLLGGSNSAPGSLLWEASDLSTEVFTNILSVAWNSSYDVTFRNCRFGSDPTLQTGTYSGPGGVILKMHNCDDGDTQHNFAEVSYSGEVTDETTIIRTGGGAQSHKMVSSANSKFWHPLTVEGAIYNSTLSARTLTVEVIHSGVGAGAGGDFTDAELWLEVIHQGTSGYPQGVLDVDDRVANILTAGTDQPNSSETWASSPATPVKQYLQCSFTPAEVGYVHYKVCLATPSKTVYVDILGATLA
jgi:hypothetical protein